MPNEYSIEVHNFLSQKIETTKHQLEECTDSEKKKYLQGCLTELAWIRDYLKENIDLKEFKYY